MHLFSKRYLLLSFFLENDSHLLIITSIIYTAQLSYLPKFVTEIHAPYQLYWLHVDFIWDSTINSFLPTQPKHILNEVFVMTLNETRFDMKFANI